MAPRLVTKTELAQYVGRSKSAISKRLERTDLKGALVGDRINVDHPATVAFVKACGKEPYPAAAPTPPTKKPSRKKAAPTAAPAPASPPPAAPPAPRRAKGAPPVLGWGEDVAAKLAESDTWGNLTLREIAARHGTFRTFTDVLTALKTIEDIRKGRLHNEETEGSLISRDLVKAHVIDAIDALFRRLLGDTPKTIARLIYAAAKGGSPVEEAEKIAHDQISSQLKTVKSTAERVLRNA